MIETVEAERFDHEAVGGATLPIKMECVTQAGDKVDVFVKCSSAQCSGGGLVRELVGCLLAKHLGFVVGRPVLVTYSDELLDQIRTVAPSCARRMRAALEPAFGSVWLGPGFRLCRPPLPDAGFEATAAEVWAFDQLAMNPDRNFLKPNCMINRDILALIDHEKALSVQGIGGFLPAPWEDRWVPVPNHLFHDIVRSRNLELQTLKARWRTVDSEVVDQIVSSVPTTWDEVVKGEIGDYLIALSNNLDQAFLNLQRVMQ
jgi:hypothetical protein